MATAQQQQNLYDKFYLLIIIKMKFPNIYVDSGSISIVRRYENKALIDDDKLSENIKARTSWLHVFKPWTYKRAVRWRNGLNEWTFVVYTTGLYYIGDFCYIHNQDQKGWEKIIGEFYCNEDSEETDTILDNRKTCDLRVVNTWGDWEFVLSITKQKWTK